MAQVALILAWVAVLSKARSSWRSPAAPARRALWLALLALALGWTLRVPAGYRALDVATATPNLAQLVGDGLALATGCAILGMLLYQSTGDSAAAGRRLRARVGALVVVLAVMAISFSVGDTGVETTSNFVAYHSAQGFYVVYSLAYLTYLAYVFVDLFLLCRRYAAASERRPLRVGLRLIEGAGACGVLYVVLRASYLTGVHEGRVNQLRAYEPISRVLVATLSLLAIVGASLPALGSRIESYRAYRQLRPLWAGLNRATPGIALEAPESRLRELLGLRDLRFRLQSRIIEIRDGRLALRRYFRRDVAARAQRAARRSGMSPPEEIVTVEAATLAAAVDDKVNHRPPPAQAVAEPVAPGGADLEGELSFLRRVTRAYIRSRVVRESARHDDH